jgi:hypothetical protein
MTYRTLDANNDYTFGQGPGQGFLTSTQAVAQAIRTRLLLFYGEWFLNVTDGFPLWQKILGKRPANKSVIDSLIQARILGTPNVLILSSFSSTLNSASRTYQFSCKAITAFSATVNVTNMGGAT